jgi:uncharacterized RDD family membrane protein YckC
MTDLHNDSLYIETPENLPLEAEIAGFASRFLAAAGDYVLIFILTFLFALLFSDAVRSVARSQWTAGVYVIVQFLLMTFYHLFFELIWNGQTPGKRSVKIRVVQANGMPASPTAIIIRNFVRLFDFLPLFYGVGMLATLATKHTQRLGDLAARTIVIYERPEVQLWALKTDWRVQYHRISRFESVPAYVDIRSLTEADRLAVINYLQRRETLSQHGHLVIPLAHKIADRMNSVEPLPSLNNVINAETFLEWVARAFELSTSR